MELQIEHPDLQTFKQESPWFFQPGIQLQAQVGSLPLSESFRTTFPTLFKLLSQASVLDVTMVRKKETWQCKLLTWFNGIGQKSGWLLQYPDKPTNLEISAAHQLLSDSIGGIRDSYYQAVPTVEMLTDNQNFVFLKSECHRGLEGWTNYYLQACADEQLEPIDTGDFICFATEANGDETYYDLKTDQVYLFAHDHAFDYVTPLEGQPDYTFYTIHGVKTFTDYVETLAGQWLSLL